MRRLSSLTLSWPVRWADLFDRERRLIVEIGFGQGGYLLNLAHCNPDANIIGLEVSNQCLLKVEKAIERQQLTNVRVIHSRAETALHHLLEPAAISQIHINFPDPWFKRSHEHRRLMKRETLDATVNRLVPGGMLYLATDIVEYARMCADLLDRTPGLDNTLSVPWADSIPGRFTTKYETKAKREGRDCYYFAYRRNVLPAPVVPVIKDLEMPHIVFKTPLTLDEMLATFHPAEYAFGDTHISLLYAYRGEKALLFEIYVKEPTIDQRVAIVLIPREQENEYTLKLGALGNPRPTGGIHQAVALLGAWLTGLHPDIQVLKNKVKTSP